jgi:hypothetical protein
MEFIIESAIGGSNKSSVANTRFIDFLQTTNILNAKTKDIYLRRIATINCQFAPKHTLHYWITHPDEFEQSLREFSKIPNETTGKILSNQTLLGLITVMISLLVHTPTIQEEYPELLGKWKQMKRRVGENTEDHYDSNKPNEKQKKAFMSYNDIVHRRDELPHNDARLLISMYIDIPPVRSDLANVKIFFNEDDAVNASGNYIIMGDSPKLILNNFKTAKNYGKIESPIPKGLYGEIVASLKAKPRDYLFVDRNGAPYSNAASWNVWANRILKKVINDNFNMTMFRHIYLSRDDLDLSSKTRKERKKIASKMGHSLEQQDKYTWKS